MKYLLLLWLISCITQVSCAGTLECSNDMAKTAELSLGGLKSWGNIFQYYSKFSSCDDGSISEGLSDIISIQFSNHWNNIVQLNQLLKNNSDFEKFVLRHIDETIPSKRLINIKVNAVSSCPADISRICKIITDRVNKVMSEE